MEEVGFFCFFFFLRAFKIWSWYGCYRLMAEHQTHDIRSTYCVDLVWSFLLPLRRSEAELSWTEIIEK